MDFKKGFSCAALVLACSASGAIAGEKKIGSTLNKKVELSLDQVPIQALEAIKTIKPDFIPEEVEKEFKHGNVYLDVEGMSSGSEIEFDMLQTQDGWKVVEVQRDLSMEQLPSSVLSVLNAKLPDIEPKRIIESVQHGTDVTVFELYSVDAKGKEARTEVKLEKGEATILNEEWTH